MAKLKDPVQLQPDIVQEQDPVKISSLDELQSQAKYNTRSLMADARRGDEVDRELRLTNHRIEQIGDNPKEKKLIDELQALKTKLIALEKEQVELHNRIKHRRLRSGAMIRRRTDLEKQKQAKEEDDKEREKQELSKRLKLADLVERRSVLEKGLVDLAHDMKLALMKANGPDKRDLARRLAGVERALLAAHEALRRAPTLVIVDEESV